MLLDNNDLILLQALQTDCKQTNKQLAHQLNLSVTAVYERIKKLERSGVIKYYVALLDREKINLGFMVFCHVKLVQHARESLTDFEQDVLAFTEVAECFHVSGSYDYLLKVLVKDMAHFRNFLLTKLTTLNYIASTESSFVIEQILNTTKLTPGQG
ncbi:MAG: AsnC family transcriptional regulator [Cryomorphaceae bacterium BACL21 MAG-121220-bin10]|jgi:Lrp/AsnC family transcriptional regulator, leucine-responsive regulatory protein|nr:MAG: AsnC family transcriptional regulator [Cryomorphaceae bacterium BACL21 MAG-121220-bin10]MDA0701183.1 Lrp/AsnC family transcriptional regulator [Bacteroidota bacterium]MDB9781936.1 Lrp/AsnC family transcriptional regulator [Winogradskyella sp.]|tara:strand:+ start:40946 stop:41413 length:468 start_codon:yes stop_codon:yes gene_type:complete